MVKKPQVLWRLFGRRKLGSCVRILYRMRMAPILLVHNSKKRTWCQRPCQPDSKISEAENSHLLRQNPGCVVFSISRDWNPTPWLSKYLYGFLSTHINPIARWGSTPFCSSHWWPHMTFRPVAHHYCLATVHGVFTAINAKWFQMFHQLRLVGYPMPLQIQGNHPSINAGLRCCSKFNSGCSPCHPCHPCRSQVHLGSRLSMLLCSPEQWKRPWLFRLGD